MSLSNCGAIFGSIFIPLFFLGCNSSGEKKKTRNLTVESQKVILMDTIYLKYPDGTQIGSGFCKMVGDSVYFFDEVQCNVSCFTKNGKYVNSFLSKGKGPGEVQGIQTYLNIDNRHLIMSGYNVYLFDKDWKYRSSFNIDFNSKISIQELSKNPRSEYQGIYEVKYFQNKLTKYDSTHILFNIESSHPKFNAFISEDYYRNGRILASLNILTGKVDAIIGKRTTKYLKYKYIPDFDFFNYELVNDTFYINYEPDHLIYVMDKNFEPLYSFGIEGINMKVNYRETNSLNAAFDRNRFLIDRTEKGYYTDLKVFPPNNTTFRTYTQGISADSVNNYEQNPKRLQVYRDLDLIADSPVPYNFKIIGYSAPFYYAEGYADNPSNSFIIYKFNIQ